MVRPHISETVSGAWKSYNVALVLGALFMVNFSALPVFLHYSVSAGKMQTNKKCVKLLRNDVFKTYKVNVNVEMGRCIC